MPKISTRAGLVAAAALAAAVLPAAAASAESAVVHDKTGDVWEAVYNPETGASTFEEAGSVLNSDIKQTTVRHTDRRVQITVEFVEMKPKRIHPANYGFVRLDDDTTWVVGAYVDDEWNAQAFMGQESLGRGMAARRGVACQGMKAAADYEADTLSVSVPRSCLGNPRWIEYNGRAVGQQSSQDSSHMYFDNAQNKGHGEGGWSDRIKKG